MHSVNCKDCKWVLWLVGLGLGVRCNHPKNKKGDKTILISEIPIGCEYKTEKLKCINTKQSKRGC